MSSASVDLATVFDDSADDSPSHSHHSLEAEDQRRDKKVGKYCGVSLLECEGDEVRMSCVREERGELVV